jgi:serine phosphatase RsbU (regulator of sigma subunit)
LKYAGAGHPGAIVVTDHGEVTELESSGLIVGVMEDYEYETESFIIPDASTIYLITDGCFEVIGENQPLLEVEEMFDFLTERKNQGEVIQDWYDIVKDRHLMKILDDDFTMLAARFRVGASQS